MNPMEYINKCSVSDLLLFREETRYFDKNKILRHQVRLGEIMFIAYLYMNKTVTYIAEICNKSVSTVKSQISLLKNKGLTERDRLEDLMREIAYWKYKQLNKLNESTI